MISNQLRKVLTTMCLLILLAAASPSWSQDLTPRGTGLAKAPPELSPLNEILHREMNQPVFQTRNPRYRLHIGDTIEIDLPLVPSFNQVSVIQPDGYITLHNLGELRIAGKTVPEATAAIKQAYSKIMENPVMTLELKDFERPYFIASGEVARPGKYELRGETTVTEAMAIAGGISDVGKRSQVLLFRRISDNDVQVKRLNLKKMFDDKNLREDVYLQPGDLLFIPKSNASAAIKALLPHTTTGLYLPVR